MKRFTISFLSVFFIFPLMSFAGTATFDDLSLESESHWVDSEGTSGNKFISDDFTFNHSYTDWGGGFFSWAGFSYSNRTNSELTGLEAQFNAVPLTGVVSNNYAVAYCDSYTPFLPKITVPAPRLLTGVYVTNNIYAYNSMKNGDAYAKKFEEGDWFKLTITGRDAADNTTGTIEVLLAQGTTVLNKWKWVDLKELGIVKTIEFSLSSSDTGDYGMNTPAYFCIDSFNSSLLNIPGDYDGDNKITLADVIALLQILTGDR